jgi:hypothetical protein
VEIGKAELMNLGAEAGWTCKRSFIVGEGKLKLGEKGTHNSEGRVTQSGVPAMDRRTFANESSWTM